MNEHEKMAEQWDAVPLLAPDNSWKQRYEKIASVFSEGELILLEDALRKYEQDSLSEKGEAVLDELKASIIAARRWAHQFGKSQH